MPKWSSFFTRILLQMGVCVLAMSLIFYGLSSYYFTEIYLGAHYSVLDRAVQSAGRLMEKYAAGEIGQEKLKEAVNPALSTDDGFYMLLDQEKQVLAYTESAAPYFAGGTISNLLKDLEDERSAIVRMDGPAMSRPA